MDFEEFKKIIDKVKTPEEFIEVTSKMDITSDELIRLNEQYNKQYEPQLKEIRNENMQLLLVLFGLYFYNYFLFI